MLLEFYLLSRLLSLLPAVYWGCETALIRLFLSCCDAIISMLLLLRFLLLLLVGGTVLLSCMLPVLFMLLLDVVCWLAVLLVLDCSLADLAFLLTSFSAYLIGFSLIVETAELGQ